VRDPYPVSHDDWSFRSSYNSFFFNTSSLGTSNAKHNAQGGLMSGLPELFLGLTIIGSITGLVVGIAVFLGRKEKGLQEVGKV
jgi:hypothetical protein